MNKVSYEERAKIYTEALDTYGACAQLVVALEELSEVQKEICKAMRGKTNILHMVEEVADATIMLEQVRQIFCINEEVCKAMDHKMVRLQHKVHDEKANSDRRNKDRSDLIRKAFFPEGDPGEIFG